MKKKGKNKTDYTGLAARLYREKYNNPDSKNIGSMVEMGLVGAEKLIQGDNYNPDSTFGKVASGLRATVDTAAAIVAPSPQTIGTAVESTANFGGDLAQTPESKAKWSAAENTAGAVTGFMTGDIKGGIQDTAELTSDVGEITNNEDLQKVGDTGAKIAGLANKLQGPGETMAEGQGGGVTSILGSEGTDIELPEITMRRGAKVYNMGDDVMGELSPYTATQTEARVGFGPAAPFAKAAEGIQYGAQQFDQAATIETNRLAQEQQQQNINQANIDAQNQELATQIGGDGMMPIMANGGMLREMYNNGDAVEKPKRSVVTSWTPQQQEMRKTALDYMKQQGFNFSSRDYMDAYKELYENRVKPNENFMNILKNDPAKYLEIITKGQGNAGADFLESLGTNTGVVDPSLLKGLPQYMIDQGYTKDQIKDFQQRLIDLGQSETFQYEGGDEKSMVDGIFGPATAQALVDYNKRFIRGGVHKGSSFGTIDRAANDKVVGSFTDAAQQEALGESGKNLVNVALTTGDVDNPYQSQQDGADVLGGLGSDEDFSFDLSSISMADNAQPSSSEMQFYSVSPELAEEYGTQAGTFMGDEQLMSMGEIDQSMAQGTLDKDFNKAIKDAGYNPNTLKERSKFSMDPLGTIGNVAKTASQVVGAVSPIVQMMQQNKQRQVDMGQQNIKSQMYAGRMGMPPGPVMPIQQPGARTAADYMGIAQRGTDEPTTPDPRQPSAPVNEFNRPFLPNEKARMDFLMSLPDQAIDFQLPNYRGDSNVNSNVLANRLYLSSLPQQDIDFQLENFRRQPQTNKNGESVKGSKFPDLTGDGKVTQADILKGRGVFKHGGEHDGKQFPNAGLKALYNSGGQGKAAANKIMASMEMGGLTPDQDPFLSNLPEQNTTIINRERGEIVELL
jgi:hypothetical protein